MIDLWIYDNKTPEPKKKNVMENSIQKNVFYFLLKPSLSNYFNTNLIFNLVIK